MQPGDQVSIRTVQLHGSETAAVAATLAPLRVIKAMGFEGPGITDRLAPWSGPRNVVAMLWDSPAEAKEQPGGRGKTFPWSKLAEMKKAGDIPKWARLIVAGGLTPENVGEAVAMLSPYAVDVSSGVESTRGVKDAGKIYAFCDAVREADGERA